MALPQLRSMNGALDEGATDGKYKKIVNNRDCADPNTYAGRTQLDGVWFGFREADSKHIPGGRGVKSTPNYVYNEEANSTRW